MTELFEKAKAAYGTGMYDAATLEFLFPQLKESEDERIRKAIIKAFRDCNREDEFCGTGFTYSQIITYLEKQKERGPLTKDEEYTLHRIIEYLEDETFPSEWISLLYDIYCLPYTKRKEQKPHNPTDEDEKVRKELIVHLQQEANGATLEANRAKWKKMLNWVEKQKATNEEGDFARGYDCGYECCLNSHGAEWFEKQKEQNIVPSREMILNIWELGNFWKENLEERKGLTQLQYIQKYWPENGDYQKEQKPIEPKFKVGDRIKFSAEPKYPFREIVNIKDGAYYFDELVHLPFEEQDRWEKEQKPADEKIVYEVSRNIRKKWALNFINYLNSNRFEDKLNVSNAECKDIEEAFFSLDWEKIYKYYNKYLQNPVEWSKEYREEDIQTRFAFYTYKDDPSVLYLSNVFVEEASRNHGFGARILKAAEKAAEVIGATTICLKVKQDSPANAWYRKNGYGYVAFEDGYDWLEKNLEYMKPKQEWSEEDCIMQRALIDTLQGEITCFTTNDLISWLKSLRPQPQGVYKQIVHNIYAMLKDKDFMATNHHWMADLLNDIRVRCKNADECAKILQEPQWKPSEDQMEALKNSAYGFYQNGDGPALRELYEQLKKLM